MSNQQGLASRPWFRLASMMPPPRPRPAPALSAETSQPEPIPPRPAFLRPPFRATTPPPPPQEPAQPPPPSVASPPPPPSPSVVSPPPTVVTPSPPRNVAPSPSSAVVSPAPATPSLQFVDTAPSPTTATPSPKIVASSSSPTVVPPAPTTPSPRIVNAAPSPTAVTTSPRIVAPQSPPPPVGPQVQATNGSGIPSSPITKAPFPSFSSPKPKLSTPSSSPGSKPEPFSPTPPTQSPSPSRVSLVSSTSPTTTIPRTTTPISSPKIVKPLERTPPPSSSMKIFSHPPSPLTLPPPQLKSDAEHETRSPPIFEQKTVLVQETKEKPKASPRNVKGDLYKPIGETHNPKHDITKGNGNHKKYSDSEDFGTRIITISGENKGAIMELSPFRSTTKFGHIEKGNFRSLRDDEISESDTGNIVKGKNQKAIPSPMTAFMNSNVQGVNNSILYNCSTTHHDPGVHFSVSRKPGGSNGIHLKKYGNESHN